MTSSVEQDRQISQVIAEEQPRLRSFIRRRVPNPADAEDLLQDVFSELVQARRLLQPIDYVTGWLFRVARNRIIDKYRKRQTASLEQEMFTEGDDGEFNIREILLAGDSTPETEHLRNLFWQQLFSALDELPADQREVFVWNELEDIPFHKIAERTGEKVNTLISRKRYAVLHLRKRLQQLYKEIIEQ